MQILDKWHYQQQHTCWYAEGISTTVSDCHFLSAADLKPSSLSSSPSVPVHTQQHTLAVNSALPRAHWRYSLKSLGMPSPASPDLCPEGSCSGPAPLSCCLMLAPSLEDTFWRESWSLAGLRPETVGLAVVNKKWRKGEKCRKKDRQEGWRRDSLKAGRRRKECAADMGVDYCLEARLQLLRPSVQHNTLFTRVTVWHLSRLFTDKTSARHHTAQINIQYITCCMETKHNLLALSTLHEHVDYFCFWTVSELYIKSRKCTMEINSINSKFYSITVFWI